MAHSLLFAGIARGGGVCILVKSSIPCSPVCFDGNSEICGVDLLNPSSTIRCICVYIPPASDSVLDGQSRMLALCGDLESLLLESSGFHVICGDFNIAEIDWTHLISPSARDFPDCRSRGEVLLDFVSGAGLHQLVDHPTSRAGNILDLLLTDRVDVVLDVGVRNAPVTSDHSAISFLILGGSGGHDCSHPASDLDFKKADYDAINSNLLLTSWDLMFSECQASTMYDKLMDYIKFVCSVHVPRKRRAPRRHSLSSHIAALHRRLHDLPPTDSDSQCKLSDQIHRLTMRDRRLTESRIAESGDAHAFFNYVSGRVGGCSGVTALKGDSGAFVTSADEKASLLAQHFASIYRNDDGHEAPLISSSSARPWMTLTSARSRSTATCVLSVRKSTSLVMDCPHCSSHAAPSGSLNHCF